MSVMTMGFDRMGKDTGNLLFLEHINLRVPDQVLATDFYVSALGMTRDPYYMVGTNNFWASQGEQQMHLQEGPAQHFRGEIVIVVRDLKKVSQWLANPGRHLAGTKFAWESQGDQIVATCPWGNKYLLVEKWPGFNRTRGIPSALIEVPVGSAEAIAKFYQEIMGALVRQSHNSPIETKVQVGPGQHLVYRETSANIIPYDGHHICIYAANPGSIYDWLQVRGLVTLEDNSYQFRFQAIVNPENDETIYEIEHELRSLHHPLYKRDLVNRTGFEAPP